MTMRNTRFQVEFTADGAGNVRAEILSVGKAAKDSAKEAREAGQEWYEFGQKLGTTLRWAGFAAAAGIAVVLRNTAKASQEIPQLDAVLKSTGNQAAETRAQLLQLAEQLADRSTFSPGAIIEAETRLLSYSGILGENIPRAMQAVVDQSTRLGISLSQSAEIVGRALESPTKAAAALAQQGFGAAFTKEVREQIKALEQAGKAGEAQRVILDILEESYSGAAEAARNTFGGALSALRNELEDLLTGDSDSLPGATKALDDLVELLGAPETKQAFDSIIGLVITLTGEMANLIVKSVGAWEAVQRVVTNAGGGHARLMGGEHLGAQRSELQQVEQELARRAAADAKMREGVLSPGWISQRAMIAMRLPARVFGFEGIEGSTDAELRNRAAALRRAIDFNEAVFGDPTKKGTAPVTSVTTNGGGGTPDPDPDAARAAERMARAIESARKVQGDWLRDLASDGNPVLDAYVERLARIEDQANAMARAKVPTGEIAAYRKEMEALAADLYDKDLAEYQRKFTEETAAMAATLAGPGAVAAARYAEDMAEVERQLRNGLITADQAAERERALAGERDSAALEMLRLLQEERASLGLTAKDYEVYYNLKRAGVDANSALGESIAAVTRALQDERDAIGFVDAMRDGLVNAGVEIGMSFGNAGDAIENFGQRLQRMAYNLLLDRAVNWLFSALLGGAGSSSGAGSLMGFGNNVDGFIGTGRATGGGVGAGRAYPVVETGRPELLRVGNETWLIPGRDGVVMPARDAAAGGAAGGAATQVVVNNYGNSEVKTREEREVQPDGSVLRRFVVDVVAESMLNGQLGRIGRNHLGWRPAG